MNTGVLSLRFDDARKDTYHVFMDILKKMEIPAVVYVPTGLVDINFSDYREVGYNGLMTRKELDNLNAEALFEIACHGHMHKNDFEDIEKGKNVLLNWYPNIKKVGFASPHSDIVRSFVDDNRKRYEQIGFSYVMGGRNFDNWRLFKRGISWVARKTKSPKVFGLCYDSSMNEKKDFYLYAVPVHKLTALEQVIYLVERCVKQKKWLVLEFHGIDTADSKEYQEEFCWLEDDFVKLCQHIKDLEIKGKIKIVNPIDFVCSEG